MKTSTGRSSMADAPVIRLYRDEDLDDVLDLLRLSLGESSLLRRTRELFSWKHVDNPFGRSIMLVACAGGKPVGFRALMRWELVGSDGETVKCVRPVDTATHPDHQRQGIFRRLTLEALDIASSEGVELVFNTPNRHSAAGYAAMGWVEVGAVDVLIRPTLNMLRRSRRDGHLPHPSDLIEDPQTTKDLVSTRRPAMGLTTRRDRPYLDWRFAHPTARYAVVGTGDGQAVLRPNLRRGRRELVISDIFGAQPGVAARAARRKSRPDYLVASFQRRTPERSALIRGGLVPVPGLRALTLYARPLVDLPYDVTSLNAWDLALSDLELL
jgi:GNAT superfamily N-acetyltransferase